MRRFLEELKDFFKKGDMVLLVLCLVVAGFGCVCIASATSAEKFGSNLRYIIIQIASIGIGVIAYAIVSPSTWKSCLSTGAPWWPSTVCCF